MNVIQASGAVRDMMGALGINGSFDVREFTDDTHRHSRSTGWVGQPTGTDYEVVVTIKPLPPR